MYICSVCGDEADVLYGDDMCLYCFDEEYGDDADSFYDDEEYYEDDDYEDTDETYIKEEYCRVCGNAINPFDDGYSLRLCDSCIEAENF